MANRFTRWAAEQTENERVILSGNDFSTLRQLMINGLGIGLLPDYAVHPNDGLLPVAIHGATPETLQEALYLVMHEDVRRSPAVRAAADFLVEVLAQEA